MSHDVHTPAATLRPQRRISRFVMPIASAVVISGAIALPASAAIHSPPSSPVSIVADDNNPFVQHGGGAYGPQTCQQGFVWRDSFDGDTQCVTPAERQVAHDQNPNRQPGGGAYGPHTCKPGYVWREKFDGDTLCVTPQERHNAKQGRLIDNGPHLIGIPGE
ncbi:hypothetical protein [Streptomyces sp. NPDC058279]|uniref:hypothetical protein n=1 Tax=Streptomyces sp. NPDC058279 TaxID=3346418 RepID=UPI0036E98678